MLTILLVTNYDLLTEILDGKVIFFLRVSDKFCDFKEEKSKNKQNG